MGTHPVLKAFALISLCIFIPLGCAKKAALVTPDSINQDAVEQKTEQKQANERSFILDKLLD